MNWLRDLHATNPWGPVALAVMVATIGAGVFTLLMEWSFNRDASRPILRKMTETERLAFERERQRALLRG